MEAGQASKVVQDCAQQREKARESYTIPEAIADAQYLRRTPDAVLTPGQAKQTIDALLAALEASPCYFKAARLGLPSFTLLPYDRAGHAAIRVWSAAAEAHGCRPEKVADALATVSTWEQRPDCKWPD
jgi:hypothetical protein